MGYLGLKWWGSWDALRRRCARKWKNSPRDFLELLVFGLTFMATYEG